MLKHMFKKTYTKRNTGHTEGDHADTGPKRKSRTVGTAFPADLWRKCNQCGKPIYVEDVHANFNICPKCGGYFHVNADQRLEMIVDSGSFEEWDQNMELSNPLKFPGYEKKIHAVREKTGLDEAIVIGRAEIGGHPVVIGVCDARFMMSSMGHNMGEKITRAVERATAERLPVILFTCSGGARMQEGMVSLMQMAKTSAALKRHHEAGQLYISVLTDPTTGGVTASFAMLGDIILAEPGALIGFAGPRVIEQTIRQKLPEGFQRAEFLQDHGFVDRIVKREEMRESLRMILKLHSKKELQIGDRSDTERKECQINGGGNIMYGGHNLESEKKNEKKVGKTYEHSIKQMARDAWESVQLSRKTDRPAASDYIHHLFDDFMEFHGDRCFKEDGAIIGGIASFHGIPVTVIGQEKGKTTKENLGRNFGMPSPEGYRKALRLMKQAEKFDRPIICFVDTPGAYCGIEAEERGQGEAIAKNLFFMSDLQVPVLSIVIGEGGSGGALALAVANEVWMLEHAIYSILSPEGFASILWKDSKKANEAAKVMKITAKELKKLQMIEKIIPEEEPASLNQLPVIAERMDSEILHFLERWGKKTKEEVAASRYERFRVY